MAGEKGATWANYLLAALFTKTYTAIGNLFRDDAAPNAYLYFSLHTSTDPTSAGTNEFTTSSYQEYARVQVPRTSAYFTVAGNSMTLAQLVQFPQAGSGGNGSGATAQSFGIWTASSGGTYLYGGPVSPTIVVPSGGGNVTPQLTTGSTVTEF